MSCLATLDAMDGCTLEDDPPLPQRARSSENGTISSGTSLTCRARSFAGTRKSVCCKIAALAKKVASESAPTRGASTMCCSDAREQPSSNKPYCYRDARTARGGGRACDEDDAFLRIDLTRETGIQFMTINTIYHFEAAAARRPAPPFVNAAALPQHRRLSSISRRSAANPRCRSNQLGQHDAAL